MYKRQTQTFEGIEPGSGNKVLKFIEAAGKNYQVAMQNLVYNPGLSIMELVSAESAARLNLFVQNISRQIRNKIKNPKLRSILEFPVLFLGAKPSKTPAFYNFMNFADFGLGTWYPKGGFNAVAMGIVQLAEELGVNFQVNEKVDGFDYKEGKIFSVNTEKNKYNADIVISGADYAHTEKLLSENRNYTEAVSYTHLDVYKRQPYC